MSPRFTAEERLRYIQDLPRQRLVASLLALSAGRLLVVKPTYRDGWLLPGGVVDQDESPARACVREAFEELGLRVSLKRLVLVDHASEPGDGSGGSLHLWFACCELTPAEITSIDLPPDEIAAFELVTPAKAQSMLVPRLSRRLSAYLAHSEKAGVVFTEDGRPVVGPTLPPRSSRE